MTKHPAAGMTPGQRRDFELIAINQRPRGGYRIIDVLKAKGLIVDGPPQLVGRDCFGDIVIPTWCQYSSAQTIGVDDRRSWPTFNEAENACLAIWRQIRRPS